MDSVVCDACLYTIGIIEVNIFYYGIGGASGIIV